MIVSQSMTGQIVRFGRANLLAMLGGAALLIGSGAVQAQPIEEVHAVTVNFADLDISTPAGAESLHRRIRAAARTVCGWEDRQRPVARYVWRTCYEEALSGALATLYERAPAAASRLTTG